MNGLKTELAEQLTVLQVDIATPAGKELSEKFNAFGTPTFIFFDPAGVEVWRTIGMLDPEKVRASLPQREFRIPPLRQAAGELADCIKGERPAYSLIRKEYIPFTNARPEQCNLLCQRAHKISVPYLINPFVSVFFSEI